MPTSSSRFARAVRICGVVLAALALGASWLIQASAQQENADDGWEEGPRFELDTSYLNPIPNRWVFGAVIGLVIDSKDNLWVNHRPGSTTHPGDRYGLEGFGECCTPAPPVVQLNSLGRVVQAWGPVHETDQAKQRPDDAKNQNPDGPFEITKGKLLSGPRLKQTWNANVEEWPGQEHGIAVDEKNDAVWVVNWMPPSQILKFTMDGSKFLLRIGKREGGSDLTDTENLHGPTGIVADPDTNEVYVSDGYRGRRVVVFDQATGKFKRQWGAYGNKPVGPLGGFPVEENRKPEPYPIYPLRLTPAPPQWKDNPAERSKQFATAHCIAMSRDKIVYVCDRVNNRVQAFKTDGTYLTESVLAPRSRGWGAVWAIAFSTDPAQRFLYVADGANHKIWILRRSDLKIISSLGHAGHGPGEFFCPHAIAVDSKNNLYVGETSSSNRLQKFVYKGLRRMPLLPGEF